MIAAIAADVSLEMLHKLDVEAVGAVDIAQEDDGEVALHGVFHLDELILVGSGGVGGVGDGQAASNLLLDGHARRGVRFRGCAGKEWVHAKMADAEEALDTPAESAGNGFGEQSGGAVVLRAGGLGA